MKKALIVFMLLASRVFAEEYEDDEAFDPIIESVYLDYADEEDEEEDLELDALIPRGFAKPLAVSDGVWEHVQPYLMPSDHPVKRKLDRLFRNRVTLNAYTMDLAKFTNSKEGKFSSVVVTRHPKIKGYYLKLIRDDQIGRTDWTMCYRRCRGAEFAREAIKKFGYEHLLKVPQKWIYCLPEDPAPTAGYEQKYFIVVAEDMKILEQRSNYRMWKSEYMSHERLEALYRTIKEAGLSDSVRAFNVPFCKDGRNAFIDTDWYHQEVPYCVMIKYLSAEGQAYWNHLFYTLGP